MELIFWLSIFQFFLKQDNTDFKEDNTDSYIYNIYQYIYIYNYVYILYIYICVYTGEGNGNPLQYSCLENESLGQRSLTGYTHGVTKNQTQLSS